MKMKGNYCENIGRFIYTYKYVRKTTNQLSVSDMIKIEELMQYFCDNGYGVIESKKVSFLLKENEELKEKIKEYEARG